MKNISAVLILCASLVLVGCSWDIATSPVSSPVSEVLENESSAPSEKAEKQEDLAWAQDGEVDDIKNESIQFLWTEIQTNDRRVVIEENQVQIRDGWIYTLSGEGKDIQVMIDAPDEDVTIILDGLDLSNTKSSVIEVKDADELLIQLAPGSSNRLEDGQEYAPDDTKLDSTIFSLVSLTLQWSEWADLFVWANFNDAISSKKELFLDEIDLRIESVDDGVVADDYISIVESVVKLTTTWDAIKTTKQDDEKDGDIFIQMSDLVIDSAGDGIVATRALTIDAGDYMITTSANNNKDTPSTKWLKAQNLLTIVQGNLTIDSLDDALHSQWDLVIDNWVITLSTNDDAIHAENLLTINNGTIQIQKSYEAIEALAITINGGEITMTSDDDGLNISGEATWEARGSILAWGQLTINGWNILLDASGDGLDSNGNMTINGWTIIVEWPVQDNNGAIDVNGSLSMNNGVLLAVGSAWMAEYPDPITSEQASLAIYFTSALAADTEFEIKDSKGASVVTYRPSKTYQSIIFSSGELIVWESYTLLIDQQTTESFTLEEKITIVGEKIERARGRR